MSAGTAGYVLVGGHSSRFGADKALAPWQGRPLAAWVAEQVRLAAGSVVLVGSPEKYQALGLPVIADELAGIGPLAGLATALGHSQAQWNLVTACDMPHLTREFLAFLLCKATKEAVDILLPFDPQGRAEPLCAVYARPCCEAINEALRRGVRKMTEAFTGLRVRELHFAEYAAFDHDGLLLANWNTPADLAGARAAG
ncbi:MAG: molybdenum cofactor guanylyltransferase [Acidobacteria bacterium]|nr:molybdenum cofactor guanylyltransferase [Acidobacteriota bacterium]